MLPARSFDYFLPVSHVMSLCIMGKKKEQPNCVLEASSFLWNAIRKEKRDKCASWRRRRMCQGQ